MNGRGYVTNDKGGYRAARAAKKIMSKQANVCLKSSNLFADCTL